MQGVGCCAGEPDFLQHARDLDEMAADPALQDCCRRDLEHQAKEAVWKAELAPHDRSQARQRLAQQVVRRDARPPPPPAGTGDLQGADEEEEDEQMERLRSLRLHELQQHAQARQRMQDEGHGSLTTVPASRLMDLVAAAAASCVVCHVGYEGDAAGAALDEHLSSLAHAYLATRFLRCVVQPGGGLLRQLGLPPGPALVGFRDGRVVDSAPLEVFGAPEEVEEEAVDRWLRGKRMLCALGSSAAAAGAPAEGSSDEEQEEGGSAQHPCELCGRRYAHQHIRSVYMHRDDGSTDDDD